MADAALQEAIGRLERAKPTWASARYFEDLRRLIAAAKDDPECDGTPFCHPAYQRGEDAGVAGLCIKINEILDGKDNGAGVSREPWESTRRRLIAAAKGKASS